MEGALTFSNIERQLLLDTLDGVTKVKYLAVASSVLLCYDYALTLDQELDYFWSGPWNKSRVLFLVNRYFPPIIMIFALVCLFTPNLTLTFCENVVPALVALVVTAICIIQAIIVLRTWYLYSNSPIGRLIILACYFACTITSYVILAMIWHEFKPRAEAIPGIRLAGCEAPAATQIWKIFVISLVMHTILYIATTIPAVRMRYRQTSSPFMNRVLRDGGVFYLVIFVSVGFSSIGALQASPKIALPAIYSNFMLCISSISVSRLMLSIQSLAAGLNLDSRWLLNNAELSRVRWRKGAHDGELIVEVEVVEVPDRRRSSRSHNPRPTRAYGHGRDNSDADGKMELKSVGVGGVSSPGMVSSSMSGIGVDEVSISPDSPSIKTTIGMHDELIF